MIPENDDMSTGMEKKEIANAPDIFWSREPIMGPKGTKENPAIIPSFNTSRCVGLETEQACAARPPLPVPARHRIFTRNCSRTCWPPLSCSVCVCASQGVIWFRLEKGPLHLVADQYFKLEQIDGGDHH